MIKGNLFRDAFISGANNIANHKKAVDALNVFPVPDGDTGTNMSMTIAAAKRELERLEDDVTVSQVAKTAAAALLRGARGNSGVILSLLFRGFEKGIQGKQASAKDLARALALGVDSAYKAVMKPTEGTMLTVARMAAEKVKDYSGPDDVVALWDQVVAESTVALAKTPDMLPVLKKAGVVDAGGKGLLLIFEGMQQVFAGGGIIAIAQQPSMAQATETYEDMAHNAAGEMETDITFGYCTEFLVIKAPEDKDPLTLRAYLEMIGDSVVVVDDDEIIKCHVHTEDPGDALKKAMEYGALTSIKIENMREQHKTQKKNVQEKKQNFQYVPVDPETPYGFVSVAAGEGVIQLFKDLGASNVVSGGQTMNPSTDDILKAINATPAQTVFVLPNNKNIIMAAEQTISLTDRTVKVLPTRTIPQGLSAMLAFDDGAAPDANAIAMSKAAEKVSTGQITFAARDSDFEGHSIKEGELLALENGKLSFIERNLTKAALRLCKQMVKKDTSFLTLLYGQDVSEEDAAAIANAVAAKLPKDVELSLIPGGQPVYYLIISAE